MPDEDTLLDKYDQLYQKFLMLRLVTIGAASVLENECSPVYHLIRQHQPELRRVMDDVCTAIFWMRDELIGEHDTPAPAHSIDGLL